jgi:hypothetical protein
VIGQLEREGLAAILCESDLTHSREMLDVVFTIDRGTIRAPAAGGTAP